MLNQAQAAPAGDASAPGGTVRSRFGPLRSVSKQWAAPFAVLVGLLAYYCAIFLHYRPYDIDNPWFLSFSYDTFVQHIDSDQFMNMRFPGGMDGTHLFGKLAAYLQYALLSRVGWQQRPAQLLSSVGVVVALGLWWLQLRELGFSRRFALCFLLSAGLSEPFVSAAEKFRYEFLSFTLISLGLTLVAYGKPLLGAFCAALAVETEPSAIAGLIPLVILACCLSGVSRRLIVRLASGFLLAAAVYLALHPDMLHPQTYLYQAHNVGGSFAGGSLAAYFLYRLRHLPEAVLFVAGAVLYWRRRHTIPSQAFAISCVVLVLFALLMPHANTSYMIFIYPFLVVMSLAAFEADKRPWLIGVVVILLFLPQQLLLANLTRNLGLLPEDIAQVSTAIQDASSAIHVPDPSLRIYGDYRLWFAHPHQYQSASTANPSGLRDADVYLCYDHPPQPTALEPQGTLYCPALNRMLPLRLVRAISNHTGRIYLYAPR